jgi:hypothetical protein
MQARAPLPTHAFAADGASSIYVGAVLDRGDGDTRVDPVDDPVVATACAVEPFKIEA